MKGFGFNNLGDSELLYVIDQRIKTYDSGWQTATLTSDFTPYTAGVLPEYRKIGNIVNIHGVLKPTAELTGSNTMIPMFIIPEGFRPSDTITTVCQGSGVCIWIFSVVHNGKCCFSRYRDDSGLKNASTSVWLPFNVTFMTE